MKYTDKISDDIINDVKDILDVVELDYKIKIYNKHNFAVILPKVEANEEFITPFIEAENSYYAYSELPKMNYLRFPGDDIKINDIIELKKQFGSKNPTIIRICKLTGYELYNFSYKKLAFTDINQLIIYFTKIEHYTDSITESLNKPSVDIINSVSDILNDADLDFSIKTVNKADIHKDNFLITLPNNSDNIKFIDPFVEFIVLKSSPHYKKMSMVEVVKREQGFGNNNPIILRISKLTGYELACFTYGEDGVSALRIYFHKLDKLDESKYELSDNITNDVSDILNDADLDYEIRGINQNNFAINIPHNSNNKEFVEPFKNLTDKLNASLGRIPNQLKLKQDLGNSNPIISRISKLTGYDFSGFNYGHNVVIGGCDYLLCIYFSRNKFLTSRIDGSKHIKSFRIFENSNDDSINTIKDLLDDMDLDSKVTTLNRYNNLLIHIPDNLDNKKFIDLFGKWIHDPQKIPIISRIYNLTGYKFLYSTFDRVGLDPLTLCIYFNKISDTKEKLQTEDLEQEKINEHIKSFKVFESLNIDYISDCVEELDLIEDEIPFRWKINKLYPDSQFTAKTSLSFFANKHRSEASNFFSPDEYNKYILPIIKRILKEESIKMAKYFIRVIKSSTNISNTMGYFSSGLINKENGDWKGPQFHQGDKEPIDKINEMTITFNETH